MVTETFATMYGNDECQGIMQGMQKLPNYPLFFPDATRGMVRGLDNQDVESTGTPGVLVNTYHLWRMIPIAQMREIGGVRALMGYKGLVISDSGGFQVMSIVKKSGGKALRQAQGKVTDEGVTFQPENSPKMLLTPEISIEYQVAMGTDLMVVLDDFTTAEASEEEAKETVERTIEWARRSKDKYERECARLGLSESERPVLIGVVQGGRYPKLRKYCLTELVKIGFGGYGYGGWPMDENNNFDYATAKLIAENVPEGSLLYGLGIGKPEDIVGCTKLGWTIYDCVLPTRDARHGRMYVFREGMEKLEGKEFYDYYIPGKTEHKDEMIPVSESCDCHTCCNYSRTYLYHLFKVGDSLAGRLATIHNLRFYAQLMERLREE